MLNNKKIIHKNKQFWHDIVIKPLNQHLGLSISFAHPESKIGQRGACELEFICLAHTILPSPLNTKNLNLQRLRQRMNSQPRQDINQFLV